MSEDSTRAGTDPAGEPPGRPGGNLLRALHVPRNAAAGFGIGVALAAYLLFGVFEGPGGQYSPAYYLALGFVLAVGVGLLLTILFSLGSAYRLSRSL